MCNLTQNKYELQLYFYFFINIMPLYAKKIVTNQLKRLK